MAKMVPDPFQRKGRGSKTEKKLYNAFRKQLDDDYVIYHSLEYLIEYKATEGEVDFLIVHPRHGILIIECKGYGVHYNKAQKCWTRRKHKLRKAPGKQARDQKFDLLSKFKKKFKRSPFHFKHPFPVLMGHGVAFPVNAFEKDSLPNDLVSEIIIDSGDMQDLDTKIKSIYEFWNRKKMEFVSLKASEFRYLLNNVINPTLNVVNNLNNKLENQRNSLSILSLDQRKTLDSIWANKKILINGGAGTGKTMLALEAGRRFNEEGKRVLLLCFNKYLGAYLSRKVEEFESESKITATCFHEFCFRCDEQAGGNKRQIAIDKRGDNDFWNDELPQTIFDCLNEGLIEKYDALIVDEAQDFRNTWFELLELCLKDDNSRMAIFYDKEQNLFRGENSYLEEVEAFKFSLNENFRNTGNITKLIRTFKHPELRSPFQVPKGVEPKYIRQKSRKKTIKTLNNMVGSLTGKQKISAEKITILTPHVIDKSTLAGVKNIAGIRVSNHPFSRKNKLLLTTIGKFKGLESDIVFLLDIDSSDPLCSKRRLYVAVSRAKLLLYVFYKGKWGWSD
ncbi:MAG: NERD domain-containing protein [Myxococcota bacterium]